MASSAPHIIDWEEAMQQCGDDDEFLRELLGDLRDEVQTQITTISGIIQNPTNQPYHRIMRAAHVVKGAAANLMCGQLRQASLELEHTASAAHDAHPTAPPPDLQAAVQSKYTAFNAAGQNYLIFLQSIGV